MPCKDYYTDAEKQATLFANADSKVRSAKSRADLLSEMLCTLCNEANEYNADIVNVAGQACPDLPEWWKLHQQCDKAQRQTEDLVALVAKQRDAITILKNSRGTTLGDMHDAEKLLKTRLQALQVAEDFQRKAARQMTEFFDKKR